MNYNLGDIQQVNESYPARHMQKERIIISEIYTKRMSYKMRDIQKVNEL